MGSPEIAPRFWVPLSLRPSPPRFLPDLVPCLYLPGHPRKTWILAPYALSSPSHVDMHSWSLYIPTRLSSPVYPQQPVYIPAAIRRRYLLVDSRSLRLPARDPSQIDWILGPYASFPVSTPTVLPDSGFPVATLPVKEILYQYFKFQSPLYK